MHPISNLQKDLGIFFNDTTSVCNHMTVVTTIEIDDKLHALAKKHGINLTRASQKGIARDVEIMERAEREERQVLQNE